MQPHEQMNIHPKDDDQGMQARYVEAVRQAVAKVALQVMEDVYNPRLVVIERALEGLGLSTQENQERCQQHKANREARIQGVNHDEQPQDYGDEEVRQGFNHEVIPQKLQLARRVPPRMCEELDNDSEEEDTEDYDRSHGKRLEYKINVDIADFHGGMHVEEFLDWIFDVESFFFQYIKIPQGKRVKYILNVIFSIYIRMVTERLESKKSCRKATDQLWPRMQRMMKEYFLPVDYQHQLYVKYQNCRQGNHSVDEYMDEFYRLHTRNNMDEPEFQTITKYLGRFNQDL